MGRAKAKPINSVRGGAMGIAGAPPILRADRDCSQRAVECAVTSTPPTVATNPREAAASIAGGPPAIAVVASRPRIGYPLPRFNTTKESQCSDRDTFPQPARSAQLHFPTRGVAAGVRRAGLCRDEGSEAGH